MCPDGRQDVKPCRQQERLGMLLWLVRLGALLGAVGSAEASNTLRGSRAAPKPQGYAMATPPAQNVMLATGDVPFTSAVGSSGFALAPSEKASEHHADTAGRPVDSSQPGSGKIAVPSSNSPARLGSFEASAAPYSRSGTAVEPIVAPGLAIISQTQPCVNPPCPEAEEAAALNPFFPQPPSSKPKTSSKVKPKGYVLGGMDGGVPIPGMSQA